MTRRDLSLKPGLYVTATPIGNLGDITYRAIETLKSADLILCEDTRQTAKLCSAYDINTRRAPYHDHNASRVRPNIIKKLKDGAVICLVTDAGTPLISDPGFKLVREARQENIEVFPVPGAAAVIAALSAAGAPSDRFFFAGFPPAKPGARNEALREVADLSATLVFYETAPRLAGSLNAMKEILGDRQATVAREVTKMHEEFRDGTLSELASHYEAANPKGEIVVLVHPPARKSATSEDLKAFLTNALERLSVKEAAQEAASTLKVPRKEAYALALRIKSDQ